MARDMPWTLSSELQERGWTMDDPNRAMIPSRLTCGGQRDARPAAVAACGRGAWRGRWSPQGAREIKGAGSRDPTPEPADRGRAALVEFAELISDLIIPQLAAERAMEKDA